MSRAFKPTNLTEVKKLVRKYQMYLWYCKEISHINYNEETNDIEIVKN